MLDSVVFKQFKSCVSLARRCYVVDLLKLDIQQKIKKGELKNEDSSERTPYNSAAVRRARPAGSCVDSIKKRRKSHIPLLKGQVVYGTYPVLEALKAGRREVHKLYVKQTILKRSHADEHLLSEILSLAEEKSISVKELQVEQLDLLSDHQVHNGLCLDATPLLYEELDAERLSSCKTLLFLDKVLDAGNVGAVARSCVFFGIDGIVMSRGNGPKAITPAMSKASAGALEWLPLHLVRDSIEFLKAAKKCGFITVGTADESSALRVSMQKPLRLENLRIAEDKVVLLLGNEQCGIKESLLSFCDRLVQIPKLNQKASATVSSLNVSAAAAIFLHHLKAKSGT